ncbi:MFS transporter [Halalkalibacter urbisdiaboli]|uniref:MFS transporter n=1 Tax=Halalkalibacter urbisdiaboli TaxID=1960589 RepID=UPI000B447E50|nr:MFS transporter [Halalkalibacter urbisdiaboli]
MNYEGKQISFLKGLTFLHLGGKAVFLPFLPLFLHVKGFSAVEIGTIMGVAPLISIVAQPVVGFISDKYKTIKGILVLLYISVIATSFGIFFTENFWFVFLSFLCMHFALSPCTPLIDSISLKSLGSQKHEYGKIRLWGSLGFFFIAIISGPILERIGIEQLFVPFFVTTLLTILMLLFLKEQDRSSKPVHLKTASTLLKNRVFMVFLGLCLLVLIPHRVNDTMIVLHLEGLGATTFLIGLAWALAALSEVPIFYYLSKKITAYNELLLLSLVAIMYTIRWALYAVISSAYLITFLQVLQGVTFGLFWLIAMQMAVKTVPEHLRSTGQALLASVCFGIGGAIGGTGGGWLLEQFGSQFLYQMMAFVTLMASVLIFLFYVRYHRNKNENHFSKSVGL